MASGESEGQVVVKKSLQDFLKKHGRESSLSSIDDMLLNYMVSVLEELGRDEDEFDVEDFTDVMKEYIPDIADIDSIAITEWMFDLAASLGEKPQNGGGSVLSFCPPQSEAIAIEKPAAGNKSNKRVHTASGSSSASLPESSSPRSSCSGPSASSMEDQGMSLLTEMFPAACQLEVSHCLSTAEGDVERAAQLLLHRQDSGEAITMDDHTAVQSIGKKQTVHNDEDMKKYIVNRYSFVDTETDKRDHRPTLPKKESKKMIRYLDNQVVSVKGERFTEIKKKSPEEEERMKKTYVNLKPAKQYRFH